MGPARSFFAMNTCTVLMPRPCTSAMVPVPYRLHSQLASPRARAHRVKRGDACVRYAWTKTAGVSAFTGSYITAAGVALTFSPSLFGEKTTMQGRMHGLSCKCSQYERGVATQRTPWSCRPPFRRDDDPFRMDSCRRSTCKFVWSVLSGRRSRRGASSRSIACMLLSDFGDTLVFCSHELQTPPAQLGRHPPTQVTRRGLRSMYWATVYGRAWLFLAFCAIARWGDIVGPRWGLVALGVLNMMGATTMALQLLRKDLT